jgi:hypothetical protein
MKFYYDNEYLGAILTNHWLTVTECIELLAIDVNDLDTNGIDYDLFTMDYNKGLEEVE